MSDIIFADAVNGVSLTNGVLRIRLARILPDSSAQQAGTLLIPANQAGPVIDQMAKSLNEISEKVREQQSAKLAQEAVGNLEVGAGPQEGGPQEEK